MGFLTFFCSRLALFVIFVPYVDSFFLHGFAPALLASLFIQASSGSFRSL